MDRDTMRNRVAAARVGRLATVGADGRPHAVPVCFVLLDDVVYSAVDDKPKRSPRLRRLANVAASGRACLLVDEYAEDWDTLWWVRVDGSARVLDGGAAGAALDALAGKYAQYRARPPRGPVLAVEATSWTAWSAR